MEMPSIPPNDLSAVLGRFDTVYFRDMLSKSEQTIVASLLNRLGICSDQDLIQLWTDLGSAQIESTDEANGTATLSLDSMERGAWRVSHQRGFVDALELLREQASDKEKRAVFHFIQILSIKVLPNVMEKMPTQFKETIRIAYAKVVSDGLLMMGVSKHEVDDILQTSVPWAPASIPVTAPKESFTTSLPTQNGGSFAQVVNDAMEDYRQAVKPNNSAVQPTYDKGFAAMIMQTENDKKIVHFERVLKEVQNELSEFETAIKPEESLNRVAVSLSKFLVNQEQLGLKVTVYGNNKVRLSQALGKLFRENVQGDFTWEYLKFCESTFDCFSQADLQGDRPCDTRLFGYMTRGAKKRMK